jgi:hypothetical protein
MVSLKVGKCCAAVDRFSYVIDRHTGDLQSILSRQTSC